jgi:hypothetical protein
LPNGSPMRFNVAFAALALLAAGCSQTGKAPQFAGTRYGDTHVARVRTIFVVVQDGSAQLAATLSAQVPGSMAVAIPGDASTREAIAAAGDNLAALRHGYPRARLVLVGEAGGAALAANIAAVRPGAADALMLVACPCALPEWRAHMAKRGQAAAIEGLDPLQTAGGVPTDIRVAILAGADDPIYAPRFSRAYAEALALRGVAVDYRILPNRSTDVTQDPEVLATAQRLAASPQPARAI